MAVQDAAFEKEIGLRSQFLAAQARFAIEKDQLHVKLGAIETSVSQSSVPMSPVLPLKCSVQYSKTSEARIRSDMKLKLSKMRFMASSNVISLSYPTNTATESPNRASWQPELLQPLRNH